MCIRDSNKLYPEAAKKSSEKMLGLARAVPKIALHYKVSGIGRFRLPTVGSTKSWQAEAPAPQMYRLTSAARPPSETDRPQDPSASAVSRWASGFRRSRFW